MKITSKEVHYSLVFTGVNHLIIKHDQIPFVHIKIRIPLQSRRIQYVAWPPAFLYTQTAIANNTKWLSPGEGKLPLKLAVIEIEPMPFFPTRSSRQSWKVKGCSKRNRWHFGENTVGTVWNWVIPAMRCLDITCLCILSFRLKDFSQTEQNQLMSCQLLSSRM